MSDCRKRMLSLKKKLENWTFNTKLRNLTYWLLMVKDINQLSISDYQRRQQKVLRTKQNNGTSSLNNKRTYNFSLDMDATNSGSDLPMNKKQNICGVSFQQNRIYA